MRTEHGAFERRSLAASRRACTAGSGSPRTCNGRNGCNGYNGIIGKSSNLLAAALTRQAGERAGWTAAAPPLPAVTSFPCLPSQLASRWNRGSGVTV